jgi:aminopeptidase
MSIFDDPEGLDRFAELIVSFAANVQPGQIVDIGSEIGKEPLTRALATSAYRRGARYVDVSYFDEHVKRARLLHADEDSLGYAPPWLGERVRGLGAHGAARIRLTGPVEPGLMDDIDPQRVGRDQLPRLKEDREVVNDMTTNWTAVPCPTRAWARLVHPKLDDDDAWERLSREIAHVCRLDEDHPVAAWRERQATLSAVGRRLTEQRLDAVHFTGPGTDLRVGLLPGASWLPVSFETSSGIAHMPNLPSEEVYATPDPSRTEGVARATKPLVLGASIVRGLEIEFRAGRAVRIDATEGADVVRGYSARDEGATRLGEVALIDRDGRIGELGTVFYDTLLDENAASHLALGQAYAFGVPEQQRESINRSAIHLDFMIGGADVDVDGVAAGGDRVALLRGGAWQL